MKLKKYHKERQYISPRGWGAFTPKTLLFSIKTVSSPGKNYLRPYPYFGFLNRLILAWDVFTYRAGALYWNEEKTKP